MPAHSLAPEEIARRGKALYEERIRPIVESEHHGKFVVIDIDTGDYEMDAEHLAAAERARARKPDARLFAVRIGYGTAYRLGGPFSTGR